MMTKLTRHPARVLVLLAAALLVLPSCWMSPSHWAENEGRLEVPLEDFTAVHVKTHNGDIACRPVDGTGEVVEVRFVRKGGGRSDEDALAALTAIDVFAETEGDTLRIGWRWSTRRQQGWAARVRFEVDGPPAFRYTAESHNGDVSVVGIQGAVQADTHNGDIHVAEASADVRAASHNGDIRIETHGASFEAATHNGDIHANLAKSESVGGRIETHNGDVEVVAGPATSSSFHFDTRNGSFRGKDVGADVSVGKRSAAGKLGAGGPELRIETHNGDLRLKRRE